MYRIGHSRDIHKLAKGKKLILGGIEIPHELGLEGHSDADCLLHAITEAIIGALGLGDLGTFFPDTDDAYKGISSTYFLKEVKKILESKDYEIVNIDATVLLERPKIIKFFPSMRKKIAEILDIDIEVVNVKATRGEKIGFVGEEKGCEADCVVLLKRKSIIKKL